LTWICHICGKERPDESISVQVNDRSAELGWPVGTVQENVRYCNDNPDCARKSKTFHLKELAQFLHGLGVSGKFGFTGNERERLLRISQLLAKLAEERLKE